MARGVDLLAEEHEKAGHEEEHGKEREEDGFNQADAEVKAQAELHKEHGHQTADRREAAAADLRHGLAERDDDRLADGKLFMLLLIAVAEDDGVVDRQRQLQHDRDGVGHERDRPEQKVRAHVQDCRRNERQQQHRHLGIRLRRQNQHRHDDDRHDDDDDADLLRERLGRGIAEGRGDVHVVAVKGGLDVVHDGLAAVVVFGIVEGDVVEGGGVGIVIPGVVKAHALHAADIRDLLGDGLRLVIRDVHQHELGRAEGGELVLHQVQALVRLRLLRQVGGQLVFYLHPAAGEDREDQPDRNDQKNQIPFVDDEAGELVHEALFLVFRFLTHNSRSCAVFTS